MSNVSLSILSELATIGIIFFVHLNQPVLDFQVFLGSWNNDERHRVGWMLLCGAAGKNRNEHDCQHQPADISTHDFVSSFGSLANGLFLTDGGFRNRLCI